MPICESGAQVGESQSLGTDVSCARFYACTIFHIGGHDRSDPGVSPAFDPDRCGCRVIVLVNWNNLGYWAVYVEVSGTESDNVLKVRDSVLATLLPKPIW